MHGVDSAENTLVGAVANGMADRGCRVMLLGESYVSILFSCPLSRLLLEHIVVERPSTRGIARL